MTVIVGERLNNLPEPFRFFRMFGQRKTMCSQKGSPGIMPGATKPAKFSHAPCRSSILRSMVSTALAASTSSILTGTTASGVSADQIRPQIHRIFFGGHKTSRLAALLQFEQLSHVPLAIRVMIAIKRLCHRFDIRRP